MSRVLLIVPTATYRAADFVAAARAEGVEVVVASEENSALAGSSTLRLPLDDPGAAAARIVAEAVDRPFDAVISVDDQGSLVAALASSRLGLPTNDPDDIRATRDKAAMRARFDRHHVPQPRWARLAAGSAIEAVIGSLGFPVVIKPLSLSASRGVIRADALDDAREVVARVRRILDDAGEDPNGDLLVEEFVPGAEVAVEAIVDSGRLDVLAVFDKPDPLDGPYFEETIYVTPSRLHPASQQAVQAAVTAAAEALGITRGPVHAEARINGDRIVVLELAARTIGGLCARTLRFGLGVTLEQLVLRQALGRPIGDLRREEIAAGVMMLPITADGILDGVGGVEAARQVAGIAGLDISVPAGRRVRPLPEGDRYLGFLFARGATADGVEAALRDAHSRLDVRIRPVPPGA